MKFSNLCTCRKSDEAWVDNEKLATPPVNLVNTQFESSSIVEPCNNAAMSTQRKCATLNFQLS